MMRFRPWRKTRLVEVSSDVGQNVRRAFREVYDFTDELRRVHEGFGRDISAHNGTPGEWPIERRLVLEALAQKVAAAK
jgi:hypothetical protein